MENNISHCAYKCNQMKNWYRAFNELFVEDRKMKMPYVFLVLSDNECWEETEHEVKFNRRMVAKKMIADQNRGDISNKLSDYERYRVACWCCLEDDVSVLLGQFKENCNYTIESLNTLIQKLSLGDGKDHIIEYWTYVASDNHQSLELQGKNIYVYGLHVALRTSRVRVEAVEYFWNKIKFLPEHEVSDRHKEEIFMKSAIYAASNPCNRFPEVFEFCFSKISCDKYPKLLKSDISKNKFYCSLNTLLNAHRFDMFQRLFDITYPSKVSGIQYSYWFAGIAKNICRGNRDVCMRLFMYLWNKEEFYGHCYYAVRKIVKESWFQPEGQLFPFIRKNYLEPVWAVLDKCTSHQVKEFMTSKGADYIRSVLRERKDKDSLDKFLSYS